MIKVAVIEDTSLLLTETLAILELEGFDAQGAINGRDGLDLIRTFSPDVIVCDVTMPALNGWEVLHQVRADPKHSMTPFLFLTARATREDIREGMTRGADDYITKPFTSEELLASIRAQLQKRRAHEQFYTNKLERAQEDLERASKLDSLTGLPNRPSLEMEIENYILSNQGSASVSLLLIDLDRFKYINEALGAENGDQLLLMVTERLKQMVSEPEQLHRIGGDTFAILCPQVFQKQQLTERAQAVLQCIKEPLHLLHQNLHLTACVGMCTTSPEMQNPKELLVRSELAMRYAKGEGGNQFKFYEDELKQHAQERLRLEGELHKAIERQQLRLYYQPKFDIEQSSFTGTEALLRWEHPELGLIPPIKFIPLAEENGLILPIGEWALRQACQQIVQWNTQGFAPLQIAVNVSGVQLKEPAFVHTVKEILEETQIDPSFLELELTETIFLSDLEMTLARLNDLREMGVKISIDDFGTGYSSLAYLKNFPVDALKIDRAFLRNIDTNPNDMLLVESIIKFAQLLKLEVIAEGVETLDQLLLLQKHSCHKAQGYYFSRPLPQQEFEALLVQTHPN